MCGALSFFFQGTMQFGDLFIHGNGEVIVGRWLLVLAKILEGKKSRRLEVGKQDWKMKRTESNDENWFDF